MFDFDTKTFQVVRSLVGRLREDRRGSVSMEYGIVATLVSIALVSALTATGDGVAAKWNDLSNTVVGWLR